ncbi:CsbD family protein [Methylobacterium nigriterrae]|uniref:CsbD family protein n=1 Tax=Methylobacterium nigriterrae TaxID=3127512 RepID=UPI003013E892
MNDDRIEGSATNMGGKLKEGVGRATGDEKLKNEGLADQIKGKVQNAIGGIKDALKGK